MSTVDKTRLEGMLQRKRVLFLVVLVMTMGMLVLFGCGRAHEEATSLQSEEKETLAWGHGISVELCARACATQISGNVREGVRFELTYSVSPESLIRYKETAVPVSFSVEFPQDVFQTLGVNRTGSNVRYFYPDKIGEGIEGLISFEMYTGRLDREQVKNILVSGEKFKVIMQFEDGTVDTQVVYLRKAHASP